MLFQNYMTFFLLLNIKGDILIQVHAALFHAMARGWKQSTKKKWKHHIGCQWTIPVNKAEYHCVF